MLQIWDVNWFLDVEQCPCDAHFVEWLEENKVKGKTVFHFGTGGHHHIGLANQAKGCPNDILGITASPKEFDHFVKLAIEHAEPLHARQAGRAGMQVAQRGLDDLADAGVDPRFARGGRCQRLRAVHAAIIGPAPRTR